MPEAEEGFRHGMPLVRLGKEPLYGYAAWKKHDGLYPMTAGVLAAQVAEPAAYDTEKGTVRFPLHRPVPLDLVAKLARSRAEELRSAKP